VPRPVHSYVPIQYWVERYDVVLKHLHIAMNEQREGVRGVACDGQYDV